MPLRRVIIRSAVMLIAVVTVSLFGCGGNTTANTKTSDTATTTVGAGLAPALPPTHDMATAPDTNDVTTDFGKDTTFIFKDTVAYGPYKHLRIVFIDNNKNSELYDQITGKPNVKKTKSGIPWTNWEQLGQYKGEFYAYMPCDGCHYFARYITDTTFFETSCGAYPGRSYYVIDQKKIDDKTFELDLTYRKIIIHIIDPEKGIAVFEEIDIEDGYKIYYLMIAGEKIRNVPIIVNRCPEGKIREFDFDEPDFEALLKTK